MGTWLWTIAKSNIFGRYSFGVFVPSLVNACYIFYVEKGIHIHILETTNKIMTLRAMHAHYGSKLSDIQVHPYPGLLRVWDRSQFRIS